MSITELFKHGPDDKGYNPCSKCYQELERLGLLYLVIDSAQLRIRDLEDSNKVLSETLNQYVDHCNYLLDQGIR